MKTILKAKTSCDDQFIERVARFDPFEYWNRCIAPGTGREKFDLKEINIKITISKNKELVFNHEIEYEFENVFAGYENHNNIIDALTMYFGTFNIEIAQC